MCAIRCAGSLVVAPYKPCKGYWGCAKGRIVQDVEHDVRRDADHIGGQHQPAQLPVLGGGRQLRAADGVHAGRAGQAHGQSEGDSGEAVGHRDQVDRRREGTRLAAEADRRQSSSGRVSNCIGDGVGGCAEVS